MIDRTNGEEPAREAEWAWVADAYRDMPAPRPTAVDAAVAAVGSAIAVRHRSGLRRPLWWLLGAAAGIAIAVFGWRRMAPRQPAPLAEVRPHGAPVAPIPLMRGSGVSESVVPVRPAPPSPSPRALAPAPAPAPPPADLATQAPPASNPPVVDRRDEPVPPTDSVSAPAPVVIAGVSDAELARLRAGLGEEGLRNFAGLLRRTAGDGLPTAPLLDRAMAGLAHGATSSVILDVVERRAAVLRQARGVLGMDATAVELAAGADALEGGVGAPQLVEMQRRFPQGRSTAGLLALAGLVADGIPASAAVKALVQGVDAGASDATLLSWRAGVMADVARGVAPLAALQAQVDRLGDRGVPDQGDSPADRGRVSPRPPAPPTDIPRSP